MSNRPPHTWLAGAFLAAHSREAQAQRFVHAAFIGVALGLMSRDALAAVDEAFYRTQKEPMGDTEVAYTDPVSIRSGFAEWEQAVVDRYFTQASGVVAVTGAGAGREVRALQELGFEAVGFEPHPGLREGGNAVLLAEGRGEALIRPSERDRFPAVASRLGGVIVGWSSYSHIPSRDRRIHFLREARSALAPGAPLLLSFWPLKAGELRYHRIVRRVAAGLRRLTRGEPVEIGDTLSPVYVHCFTQQHVRDEAAASGFECVCIEGHPYPHAVLVAV